MSNTELELEKDLDINPDEIEDEGVKKTIQTLSAQKAHFKTKSQEKDLKIKELETKLSELVPSKEKEKVETQTDEKYSKIEKELNRVRLEAKGYTEEEIEFIEKVGDISNPYVKKAIDTMRAEKKSQDAIPEGSGKSPIFKKYTEAQLKNMSSTEMEKILNQQ